ncbi:hypothetical protein RO3G_01296 [Lichtheimia corymbifera JMRC:FSU:9682]|uniref:Uncharacterized protein n=1 Tax=Lichtheimia corymbifera JMRC:FSU:9682 TaxID=1263082 RepID=A0A068S9L7_9FUNG|nr:hypothetical protein RO3G_01296 [Lichtheimia corymbifera JMRC:FSU:9682]
MEYLNTFSDLNNIKDIAARGKEDSFDFDDDFDLDWAQLSIRFALRLFESGYLPLSDQAEADIIRRGRNGKYGKFLRRNSTTTGSQLNRKKHGHRADFLFKTAEHEFGCAEVGKKDEGEAGRKELSEGRLSCPKMVHDMMPDLTQGYSSSPGDLVMVGFIMMGLKPKILTVDRPSTYTCRVSSTDSLYFPTRIQLTTKFSKLLIAICQELGRQHASHHRRWRTGHQHCIKYAESNNNNSFRYVPQPRCTHPNVAALLLKSNHHIKHI